MLGDSMVHYPNLKRLKFSQDFSKSARDKAGF